MLALVRYRCGPGWPDKGTGRANEFSRSLLRYIFCDYSDNDDSLEVDIGISAHRLFVFSKG